MGDVFFFMYIYWLSYVFVPDLDVVGTGGLDPAPPDAVGLDVVDADVAAPLEVERRRPHVAGHHVTDDDAVDVRRKAPQEKGYRSWPGGTGCSSAPAEECEAAQARYGCRRGRRRW